MFIKGESNLKVSECIYHRVFINEVSRLKGAVCIYRHLFINWESAFKVAVCIYHHVFIIGERKFKSYGMDISSRVHQWKGHLKAIVCIYHLVFIDRRSHVKVVVCIYHLMLFERLYILMCVSMAKSLQSCGIKILSCFLQLESHFKDAAYVYAIVNSCLGKVIFILRYL